MTKRQIRKLIIRAVTIIVLVISLHGVGKAIAYDVNRLYSTSPDISDTDVASIGIGTTPNVEDIPCGSLRDRAERGEDVELVASAIDNTVVNNPVKYEMWLYEEAGMIEYTVTRVSHGGLCGLAYVPYDDEFTNRIPLNIARELMLQLNLLKAELAGGLDAYRQQVIEDFTVYESEGYDDDPDTPGANDDGWGDEPVEITSVDKWVFDRFGIVLPEDTYVVRDIDDGWDYEYEPGATEFPNDSDSK